MTLILGCIGCGEGVMEHRPGAIVAISCRCGAYAPILSGGRELSLPASLIEALGVGKSELHLEYYLGYSDHTSSDKETISAALSVLLGITSQADCPESQCKQSYRKGKERYQALLQRKQQAEIYP